MKRILSIAFVIIGILAIIFAFSAYDLETGYKESNEKYGGDAYTGIQNAANRKKCILPDRSRCL